MNAHHIRDMINTAERELTEEIGKVISRKLNALCTETGVKISGLQIQLTDVTGLGDPDRKFVVTDVAIDARLPD